MDDAQHQTPATGPEPGFWRTFADAFRGTGEDLATVSVNRAVILLVVPMVMEMVLQSLFAIINLFWVSRLGGEAIAAVGLTEAVMSLVFAVGMGCSLAATAMVARRAGERDLDGAAVVAVQALLLGLLLSLLLAAAGYAVAPHLLGWMGATPAVQSAGYGYLLVSLVGSGSMLILAIATAVLRGIGDAVLSMRLLWACNLLNMALDPLLIYGLGPIPALGVTGAAVATLIARSVGIAVVLYMLWRGVGRIRIAGRHLVPHIGAFLRLSRMAATGFFQFSVPVVAWLGTIRIVSLFGPEAVAASTIALRVLMFFVFPAWGLNRAAATLVGQSLGARRPDRAEAAVWITARYSTIFLVATGLLLIVFAEPLVRCFTDDPRLVPPAVACLRILCCGNLAYGYGMVVLQGFNGAGDAWTPTWLVLICSWVLGIPLSYALAVPMGIGFEGVFIAHVVVNLIVAVAAIQLFRRGRWKQSRI